MASPQPCQCTQLLARAEQHVRALRGVGATVAMPASRALCTGTGGDTRAAADALARVLAALPPLVLRSHTRGQPREALVSALDAVVLCGLTTRACSVCSTIDGGSAAAGARARWMTGAPELLWVTAAEQCLQSLFLDVRILGADLVCRLYETVAAAEAGGPSGGADAALATISGLSPFLTDADELTHLFASAGVDVVRMIFTGPNVHAAVVARSAPLLRCLFRSAAGLSEQNAANVWSLVARGHHTTANAAAAMVGAIMAASNDGTGGGAALTLARFDREFQPLCQEGEGAVLDALPRMVVVRFALQLLRCLCSTTKQPTTAGGSSSITARHVFVWLLRYAGHPQLAHHRMAQAGDVRRAVYSAVALDSIDVRRSVLARHAGALVAGLRLSVQASEDRVPADVAPVPLAAATHAAKRRRRGTGIAASWIGEGGKGDSGGACDGYGCGGRNTHMGMPAGWIFLLSECVYHLVDGPVTTNTTTGTSTGGPRKSQHNKLASSTWAPILTRTMLDVARVYIGSRDHGVALQLLELAARLPDDTFQDDAPESSLAPTYTEHLRSILAVYTDAAAPFTSTSVSPNGDTATPATTTPAAKPNASLETGGGRRTLWCVKLAEAYCSLVGQSCSMASENAGHHQTLESLLRLMSHAGVGGLSTDDCRQLVCALATQLCMLPTGLEPTMPGALRRAGFGPAIETFLLHLCQNHTMALVALVDKLLDMHSSWSHRATQGEPAGRRRGPCALASNGSAQFAFMGLVNHGETCFASAVLQQLYHSPSLRGAAACVGARTHTRAIDQALGPAGILPTPTSPTVRGELAALFASMALGDGASCTTARLLDACSNTNAGASLLGRQCSADEFYSRLVHLHHEACTAALSSNCCTCLRRHVVGRMKQTFESQGCCHTWSATEEFVALSLPVQNMSSVGEALEEAFRPERLTGRNRQLCPECNTLVETLKHRCAVLLPDTLVVALGRLSVGALGGGREKLNGRCEFPMAIDLSSISASNTREGHVEPERAHYQLRGVVMHQGTALNGHYTSIVRQGDGTRTGGAASHVGEHTGSKGSKGTCAGSMRCTAWAHCDDEHVTLVPACNVPTFLHLHAFGDQGPLAFDQGRDTRGTPQVQDDHEEDSPRTSVAAAPGTASMLVYERVTHEGSPPGPTREPSADTTTTPWGCKCDSSAACRGFMEQVCDLATERGVTQGQQLRDAAAAVAAL